jgi:rhodanese-related sulfurtransferase
MIQQLSAEQYAELIQKKSVWNLDVREKYEYEAGHIEGALLVPSTRFDEEFEKLKIKKTDKIAVYCRSGNRSDFIANKLAAKGYGSVYNLEIGLLEWVRMRLPIVK